MGAVDSKNHEEIILGNRARKEKIIIRRTRIRIECRLT